RIPYRSATGDLLAIRYRASLDGPHRFRWRVGDKVMLYGLDRLRAVREAGWVLLVEGESDCWTAWHHGLPALGVPGKTCWRSDWRHVLDGLQVFLWQEPSAEDLAGRVSKDISTTR